MENKEELLLKEEVYKIIGAAMEVHSTLGNGFLEPVYQEAIQIELTLRDIPFQAQVNLPIYYKGNPLGKYYVADLIVYEQIIVELKTADRLIPQFDAQLLNYLKATGLEVGLLLNFGAMRLEYKRKILTERSSIHSTSSIRDYSRKFADKI